MIEATDVVRCLTVEEFRRLVGQVIGKGSALTVLDNPQPNDYVQIGSKKFFYLPLEPRGWAP